MPHLGCFNTVRVIRYGTDRYGTSDPVRYDSNPNRCQLGRAKLPSLGSGMQHAEKKLWVRSRASVLPCLRGHRAFCDDAHTVTKTGAERGKSARIAGLLSGAKRSGGQARDVGFTVCISSATARTAPRDDRGTSDAAGRPLHSTELPPRRAAAAPWPPTGPPVLRQ